MDPLTIAGSVMGLISAASKMLPMLYNVGDTIMDAPKHAQVAARELQHITAALEQLQKYLEETEQASDSRRQLIDMEHISATLTDCVLTYSELDIVLSSVSWKPQVKPDPPAD